MKKNCGYFLFFITEGIGGAFGGQGVLLVYTLTLFFGMNFIVAAGTRVIISFFITAISLIIFQRRCCPLALRSSSGSCFVVRNVFRSYLQYQKRRRINRKNFRSNCHIDIVEVALFLVNTTCSHSEKESSGLCRDD